MMQRKTRLFEKQLPYRLATKNEHEERPWKRKGHLPFRTSGPEHMTHRPGYVRRH